MYYEGSDTEDVDDMVVVRETPRAILVRKSGNLKPGGEVWVPKACVSVNSEVRGPRTPGPGTLTVARWFAEKEGLG